MTSDVAVNHEFDAVAPAVHAAREVLKGWLDGPGRVQGERADDLAVVLSEMASNSVKAGASWFRLRLAREGDEVVIEVADDGHGFDAVLPGPHDVPDHEAEDGRGLFLVRTLVDRCTIFTNDGGTIVRCRVAAPG